MKPLLVAGEINVDLILSGITSAPEFGREIVGTGFHQVPGSSSMICAMGLARLGHPVRFVGRAGDDERGRFCREAMRAAGIDVAGATLELALETGVTLALSSREDRALVTYPGAIDALVADDITDAMLAAAGHLHVSSYYLQNGLRPGLPRLFARARRARVGISLDPGFDPSQRWGYELIELLADVDVFLPNRSEACALTGASDPVEALRALSPRGVRTVIKCGADGCIALEDERVVRVPARPVEAVDSTGAGDSFNAGFLHAWRQGLPLETCMRWAVACGSLSTRGVGGTARQASADEVRQWLETTP